MKFVDTNILIRLITNDVPALRQQAQSLVEAHRPGELRIPDIVFCELFFVLEHNPLYHLRRHSVCEQLNALLLNPVFTHSSEAQQALLIAQKHPKLDFTDCLLSVYAKNRVNQLLSLDKGLLEFMS